MYEIKIYWLLEPVKHIFPLVFKELYNGRPVVLYGCCKRLMNAEFKFMKWGSWDMKLFYKRLIEQINIRTTLKIFNLKIRRCKTTEFITLKYGKYKRYNISV